MSKSVPLSLSKLANLANKYDTPYYLYDGDEIVKNAKKYMTTFKKYFPNFKQFFAVKATPNPSILDLLADCGMDFDCSSVEEIKIVKLLGKYTNINPDIIYTSNYTSIEDLKYAYDNNCIINLDDIDGYRNLSYQPELICFRYNPILKDNDVDIKSNKFTGSDTKFGMTLNDIIQSYIIAHTDGIKRFGLHTMCASNKLDINFWTNVIDKLFELISILYDCDIKIEFINIGGGLGIPYKPEDKEINLEELVKLIRNSFDENIKKYNLNFEPKLYTECGRYITGPYGYLVSSCKSIKKTENSDIFYGLDANMANLMRPGMYNAYHHITIPRLSNSNDNIKANAVGTLCENNDWFAKNRLLPKNILKNDLFVIHDVGAHGFSMGFNYNSKLKSCELFQINGDITCIRGRETFDDLFRNTLIYTNYNDLICLNYYFVIFIIFVIIFYLY